MLIKLFNLKIHKNNELLQQIKMYVGTAFISSLTKISLKYYRKTNSSACNYLELV